MRIVFLLGSGVSISAGMPRVDDITRQVLAADCVIEGSDSRFRILNEQMFRRQEMFRGKTDEVAAFARELKQLCDAYWPSQKEHPRQTNYEDIAYIAQQIHDGLTSEYENPALLPLNERYSHAAGRSQSELQSLAGLTAGYIKDMVCSTLGRPVGPVDHLIAIAEAFKDHSVEEAHVATLNHDLVLERLFRETGTQYSDGFAREFGTMQIWNNTFEVGNRKLLKLHGSIDWWLYRFELDGFLGQITARPSDGDAQHARGPAGEDLGFTLDARPLILAGTFNKILAYPTGIFADQHFRFHEALRDADALVAIGYGFRDKAINTRIVAWAERPGHRRMVVVHRDPDGFASTARGAIRSKWDEWQGRGLLAFVPEHLGPTTRWETIAGRLR